MLDICDFWGKVIGHCVSVGRCMRITGLSFSEICKSLETGESVRGVIISFSDEYLRMCTVNSLIKYHDRFDCCQIAQMTGVSKRRVYFIVNKFIKKVKDRISLCV